MATDVLLQRPTPATSGPSARTAAGITRAVDVVSDLGVLGLATWTLLYHFGIIVGLHTDPLLLVWVLSLPAALWWLMRRRQPAAEPTSEPRRTAASDHQLRALIALAVVLTVLSAWMVFSAKPALWWPGWCCAGVTVLIGLYLAFRNSSSAVVSGPSDAPSLIGSLVALGSGIGLGVFSIFIVRPDVDDMFYLNKTAWVAEHGTIPTKDTLFTDQHLAAVRGAGVPVSSIETMQGAVAHALHLTGGTATYILTPPVATFLAVWAIWRLIRHWAPRRQMLCFAVGLLYLMWAAFDRFGLGEFFIDRIHHGKSIFVSMLIPLVYLYLSRWGENGGTRNAVLLFASGMAAIGLTSSATFIMPLICAGAAVPLFLQRQPRRAAGALLAGVYPVISGIVVSIAFPSVNPVGTSYTGEQALRNVYGPTWYGAIAWIATFAAFWLIRSDRARGVALGASGVLVVLTAPGVLGIMNDVTGAHAVLYRTIWVVPVPVLVGLLAAVPLPSRLRWLGPVPAAGLIVLVLVEGVQPISAIRHTSLAGSPTWRFPIADVRQARAIANAYPGSGPVLAPKKVMNAIAVTTTRIHPVDPFSAYVPLTDEPSDRKAARLLLSGWMSGGGHPSAGKIESALEKLDVGIVCFPPSWTHGRELVRQFGYGRPHRVGTEVCYRATGG